MRRVAAHRLFGAAASRAAIARAFFDHVGAAMADPELRAAVASYLHRERAAVAQMIAEHEAELPFRCGKP